jgi:hypothetical protein
MRHVHCAKLQSRLQQPAGGTAGVELQRITSEEGSYFKIYQQYHELEWQRIATCTQEFGWFPYKKRS